MIFAFRQVEYGGRHFTIQTTIAWARDVNKWTLFIYVATKSIIATNIAFILIYINK